MEDAKRILAIESSGRHGSVATLWGTPHGSELVQQIILSGHQRTAQALAPTIRQLLEETDWSPSSIGLVAVAIGPGSFTGLRIGVTTAKAFAYAIGAEIISVNTLEALAAQTPPASSPLWTVLDAQRQELFVAKFGVSENGHLFTERETSILPQDVWLAELRAGDRVTGTALSRLTDRLPSNVDVIPQELWQPMAEAIGSVGWSAYQSGKRDDVWQLLPSYYRASAAEEKRLA
jgi:tRNA threonylcarbamoyladenosine biosynthesis protein TsaB